MWTLNRDCTLWLLNRRQLQIGWGIACCWPIKLVSEVAISVQKSPMAQEELSLLDAHISIKPI
jgi:hypothetical protein